MSCRIIRAFDMCCMQSGAVMDGNLISDDFIVIIWQFVETDFRREAHDDDGKQIKQLEISSTHPRFLFANCRN